MVYKVECDIKKRPTTILNATVNMTKLEKWQDIHRIYLRKEDAVYLFNLFIQEKIYLFIYLREEAV